MALVSSPPLAALSRRDRPGSAPALLLALILAALPTAAAAQGTAEAVASRAQRAHEEHCADAAGLASESDAALALAEVSTVWAEVAQVHEASGATWLLYWRGLLAQCIGQDERAAEALVAFVESDPTAEGLAAMARDARSRLKRLRPDYAPPKPARSEPSPEDRQRTGGVAGGIILALGAAGAGVGSGAGFAQFSATRDALFASRRSGAEGEALIAQGDGQIAAGISLAGGAGVAVVASIAALAGAGRSDEPAVSVLPVPVADGVVLVAGGRW